MRLGLLVGLLLLVSGVAHSAPDIARPRVAATVVEWPAAAAAVTQYEGLQTAANSKTDALARLNEAAGRLLPTIATSPVPVLLPIDVAGILRDKPVAKDEGFAASSDAYFSGYHYPRFFLAGPGGFDSTFTILTSDIKELADISIPDPVDIHFSGFAFTYELDGAIADLHPIPVPALEAKFPGIRRFIYEGYVRYSFVQYGVPYVLAIDCFEGRPRLLRLICTQADRIAVHFLSQLRIAGGTPQKAHTIEPPVVERETATDPVFKYHGPGKIFPGSGFRDAGGRVDYTVWAQIRFPLSAAPAYANSQVYRERTKSKTAPKDVYNSPEYSYPWRDNFCERRGFTVGQCPAGIGHQGQDIRPAPCAAPLGNERCEPAHDVVAVRDGAIMRNPKQEAAYIVVNNANEHIRFRYLHMEPRKMDENNLLSGREVHEGEVIGQVSNFSQKENGTSYHLHFDVQVPTRNGWAFVSPYMTLVVGYERLIGGRGVEIVDQPQAAQAIERDFRAAQMPPTAQPVSAPLETRPKLRPDDSKHSPKNQAGVNEPHKIPIE